MSNLEKEYNSYYEIQLRRHLSNDGVSLINLVTSLVSSCFYACQCLCIIAAICSCVIGFVILIIQCPSSKYFNWSFMF